MAILLALGSSVVWGCADYMGGIFSRRQPLAAVTLVSQATGFAGLLIWLAASGFHVDGRAFGFGLLAGLGGGAGLALFYRALAVGTMSVVSPVAACSALLPFGLALAGGERPSTLVLAGAIVALGGAVLASADEHRAEDPGRRKGAVLAIAAAFALGLFIYFLGRGGQHGEALSALVGARVGSLALLTAWAIATRAPARLGRGAIPGVAVLGVLDVSANALFVLASARGYLSVVSVLGSLYPIVTVLAAYALLGERINPLQRAGVVLALAGVAVVASG
jgi:drug/metabolite transporter (DMT)-like permease